MWCRPPRGWYHSHWCGADLPVVGVLATDVVQMCRSLHGWYHSHCCGTDADDPAFPVKFHCSVLFFSQKRRLLRVYRAFTRPSEHLSSDNWWVSVPVLFVTSIFVVRSEIKNPNEQQLLSKVFDVFWWNSACILRFFHDLNILCPVSPRTNWILQSSVFFSYILLEHLKKKLEI